MTLTLILTRHAKSSWEDPTLEDFDRPLNMRGRRSAEALGQWLQSRGYRPESVLLSPSHRTRETFARMRGFLPEDALVREEARLYDADAAAILDVVRELGHGRQVLLIGHNPGIGDLAASLPARPPRHPDFGRYPTGATTVLRFPGDDWSALAPGEADALDFVVPRDLIGA